MQLVAACESFFSARSSHMKCRHSSAPGRHVLIWVCAGVLLRVAGVLDRDDVVVIGVLLRDAVTVDGVLLRDAVIVDGVLLRDAGVLLRDLSSEASIHFCGSAGSSSSRSAMLSSSFAAIRRCQSCRRSGLWTLASTPPNGRVGAIFFIIARVLARECRFCRNGTGMPLRTDSKLAKKGGS